MQKHFRHFTNCGNDAKDKCDLSLVSKVCREFDEVTLAGKLFHVRTTMTEMLGRWWPVENVSSRRDL